ncbi:MAG: hypothetical protein FRX48_06995 [Lasallia pustulata]|uniref:Enoyl reductase (ER) domain-containing protein n=1 Tax=Lasallia pustulata TaxID=136370 RepID=A0A5M8PKM8_9LECA|nr:MAG: hypothetical protein FRX48_06995 [Lasallia pustulata]
MRGIQISQTGDPSVLHHLTSLPVPTPGPHTLLVQNTHIGINYIDTYFRTGLYPSALPCVLGREAEGRVVAVGPGATHGLAVGDYVVWLGTEAYAEYSAVPAAKAMRVPDGLLPGVAAAAFLQGLTALTLVREAGEVRAGERLSEKNVKVLRPRLDNYIYTREEFEYYANELFRMMREDKFNGRIHEVYPLQDAARAHKDLESRKTTGKLLMKP